MGEPLSAEQQQVQQQQQQQQQQRHEDEQRRKIVPLQSLGFAPPPISGHWVGPDGTTRYFSPGRASTARCSFIDSHTIVGVDDNLLKMYDVGTGLETVHPIVSNHLEARCPVQRIVCNSRNRIIVLAKIIVKQQPTNKHVRGWASAVLHLEVLHAGRAADSSIVAGKREAAPLVGKLGGTRFRLEVTAENAGVEAGGLGGAAPDGADFDDDVDAATRNNERLVKLQKARAKKKSKQKSSDGSAGRAGGPSPSLNVEKARLHRGGGGGDGRSRIKKNIESKKDASSSKPQAVPGKVPTESTRASSPGSSGDLQFVPVKRIEIPLEDICLEDELAESQRTPSFHAAGGLPPRSAAGIRAQAARNAAREQAAGAAAAIQAQVCLLNNNAQTC